MRRRASAECRESNSWTNPVLKRRTLLLGAGLAALMPERAFAAWTTDSTARDFFRVPEAALNRFLGEVPVLPCPPLPAAQGCQGGA